MKRTIHSSCPGHIYGRRAVEKRLCQLTGAVRALWAHVMSSDATTIYIKHSLHAEQKLSTNNKKGSFFKFLKWRDTWSSKNVDWPFDILLNISQAILCSRTKRVKRKCIEKRDVLSIKGVDFHFLSRLQCYSIIMVSCCYLCDCNSWKHSIIKSQGHWKTCGGAV